MKRPHAKGPSIPALALPGADTRWGVVVDTVRASKSLAEGLNEAKHIFCARPADNIASALRCSA